MVGNIGTSQVTQVLPLDRLWISKFKKVRSVTRKNVCTKLALANLKNHNLSFQFNPQAPVAQKIADKVIFRRFQGEGVEFF